MGTVASSRKPLSNQEICMIPQMKNPAIRPVVDPFFLTRRKSGAGGSESRPRHDSSSALSPPPKCRHHTASQPPCHQQGSESRGFRSLMPKMVRMEKHSSLRSAFGLPTALPPISASPHRLASKSQPGRGPVCVEDGSAPSPDSPGVLKSPVGAVSLLSPAARPSLTWSRL